MASYKTEVEQKIPSFEALDHEGFKVTDHDLLGFPTVIYFYPKNETPTCTKEACSFRDSMKELLKLRAIVLGVSPDSVDSHKAFSENHQLNFTLLSDENLDLAKAFDVLKEGNKIERSTFVIDKNGKIVWIERPVKIEGHIERVVDVVKRLK